VSSDLPVVIAIVAQIMAADAGHVRADTLLQIQGADPVYVRKHLGAIDAALGAGSPGLASLTALVDQAEIAISTSGATVPRQHVISQVVLRKFIEDTPPRGRVLARYSLASGRVELIGTNGAGYVENFVPVDSKATEDLWQQVENVLHPAIAAALNGTALGDPAHLSGLRGAVALHFVRNPTALTTHNASFAEALDKHIDQTARTPLAAQAFFDKHGLYPAGPEALRLGAEASVERLVDLHREGGLFRLSVQRLFEKVRDRFDSRGVEILIPAGHGKEFLLGDVPAVTIDQAGVYGISNGVAVDDAVKIIMPLAPRLLVAVGPPDGARTITDDEVDQYNEMQVRSAREYVMYRPAANFAADIATWRI
jgi:Protein of unknown function (DUF4238)